MTTMTIHGRTVKVVFAPILGLAEPAEESPWARFYGAGANADGHAWKRDLADMRRIDENMWK